MGAEEFKKLRDRKGYSQTELAKLLRVTVRTISRWENGERKVPYIAILALQSLKKKEGRKGLMACVRKWRGEWIVDWYDNQRKRHREKVSRKEDGFCRLAEIEESDS